MERELTGMGYQICRNAPYSRRLYHRSTTGRPGRQVHALQIEISRALYFDEAHLELNSPRASGKLREDRLGRLFAAPGGGRLGPLR